MFVHIWINCLYFIQLFVSLYLNILNIIFHHSMIFFASEPGSTLRDVLITTFVWEPDFLCSVLPANISGSITVVCPSGPLTTREPPRPKVGTV